MRTRRAFVLGAASLVGLSSGCLGGSTPQGRDSTTAPSQGGDGGPTTDSSTDELDLREANVTAVSVEASGDGTYRFDVTLYHDDDGEEAYANWWQVESLDGTKLGRRTLLHAHSTAPFTRSETIEIPDDTGCVVVRGHDQTHGYGGQAMLVTLDTGATRPRRQGPDPQSFDSATCLRD